MRRVVQFNAGAGDAGGGDGLGPSLTDLMDENIQAGSGAPKTPDLSEEAQKTAAGAGAPDTPTAGDPPPGDDPKLDENGNPIVDDDDDPNKDKGEPGDDDENQDPPGDDDPDETEAAKAYWAEVAKYEDTEGIELEEGLTPEVVARNLKKVKEASIQSFEEHLKNAYPDAYNYFLHTSNGGDRESFFKNEENVPMPPEPNVVKGSVEVQEAVTRQFYKAQNLDDMAVDAIVAKLKADGLLESRSLQLRDQLADKVKSDIQAKLDAQAAETAKIENAKKSFVSKVEKVVSKGQLVDFIVPEKDRAAFAEFFVSRVAPTKDGKYVFSYEVAPEDLEVELQKEYLRFKKGNLNDIVLRKAKTVNTQNLKLKIGADDGKRKHAQGGGGNVPLPLSDVIGG